MNPSRKSEHVCCKSLLKPGRGMARAVLSLLVVPLAALSLFGQDQGEPAGKIRLEDLLSIPSIGAPLLSPDGTQFAVIQGGQIALLPVDGGSAIPLTTTLGGKSEASWSPDGKKLAFVSQGAIWIVSVSGGQPKRLTDGVAGPGDPRGATDHAPKWHPKGKWILFESGRHGQNELWVVSEDSHSTNYLASTEIYNGSDRLGDQEQDGLAVDRFDPSPAWSPDGTRLAFTERSRAFFSGKLKLLTFDAATGRASGNALELYTPQKDRGGAWAIDKVSWSPDGKTLAFTLQDSGWDKVYLLAASGGKPRQLTQGESEDSVPVFAPDGKTLAIVSNRNNLEERRIWIVPVNGIPPHQLTRLSAGVEGNPQWSPDSTKVYFLRSTPLQSPDLYEAATSGSGSPRLLTHTLPLNFENANFQLPEVAHFKTKDGLTLSGILYHPVGYTSGTRYPAVLWVHGGPEGQDTFTFSPWSLFLAQEGYVVFLPNYRGSSGYGEKFRNLNVEDSGGGEVEDIAAAATYLEEQGLADPRRIAIGGGSHGGTEVAFAVTKLPDLFAAAIDISGVSNRATFIERTNRNSSIRWATKMGGTPEEKPDVYRKADILPDVGKIKTPLLVIHGQEDPQVPPYEAAQFVAALKKQGKVFSYYVYPGEGHGFSKPENRLDSWRKQEAFLRQYLFSPVGLSSTSTDALAVPQK